ncbi:lactococcin 972 family bacteriocin [Priestia aryabhattai]|uniref:lactococcin 972 family bacteriocin n=1 Tax=Priestia TaxID=2800373 RepID=UPI001FB5476F|nr:lactococcin 972 family bacteriocin [Priestia aryabhattai]MED3951502.1 lactococcin 972 family bacteriocin [Priestia aryabhattai]
MKKIVSTLLLSGCLISSTIGVSAASLGDGNTGEVNLDNYKQQYEAWKDTHTTGTFKIFPTSTTTDSGSYSTAAVKKTDAGGGKFWVEWGGDRHWSNYEHAKKTHRSSASNHRGTNRSDWMPKGELANIGIKSSLYGNKAGWATK